MDQYQRTTVMIGVLSVIAVMGAGLGDSVSAQQADFVLETIPSGSTDVRHGTLVDLNGDEHLDLVAIDGVSHAVFFLNDGTGQLVGGATALTGPNPTSVISADIDGDGDQDVVMNDDTGVSIFRNNTFNAALEALGVTGNGSAIPFDFDGDGDVDLVFGGAGGIELATNDGTGQFAPTVSVSGSPLSIVQLEVIDWTGDGDDELLAVSVPNGAASSQVHVLDPQLTAMTPPNPSVATLHVIADTPPVMTNTEPPFAGVAVGDFDGDGRGDFALAESFREGTTNVSRVTVVYSDDTSFVTNRVIDFDAPLPFLPVSRYLPVALDHDGDGRDDLVVATNADGFGGGGGAITERRSIGRDFADDLGPGGSGNPVAVTANVWTDLLAGELDPNGGRDDLVAMAAMLAEVSILRNRDTDRLLEVIGNPPTAASTGDEIEFEIRVTDLVGVPIAGAIVGAVDSDTISASTMSVTDVMGIARVSVTVGLSAGMRSVEFTSTGADPVAASFFVRRLIVTFNSTGILSAVFIGNVTPLPLIFAVDVPLPGPGFVTTSFGDIYTSIMNPGPSLFVVDGIGLFGPPLAELVATPTWSASAPYSSTPGTTLVFQVYGIDTNDAPLPDVIVSNSVTLTF